MRELFGHRVELPTSPCVAGNTSCVKRRRRDGARASEGTASRPRDAAGSGLGRLFICWHECQLGLSDDLPSKLSQLTKPAHPRVPQSDRRMQRRSFARKVHHVVCAHNTMLAELVSLIL